MEITWVFCKSIIDGGGGFPTPHIQISAEDTPKSKRYIDPKIGGVGVEGAFLPDPKLFVLVEGGSHPNLETKSTPKKYSP